MSRRAFLAASAITATSAVTKTAAADALPLGPLPDMRYPDVRIESADKNSLARSKYEGLKQTQEQDKHYVCRVDGKTGEVKPVVDDFTKPNGICFAPMRRNST